MVNVGTTKSEPRETSWKDWLVTASPLFILTLIYISGLVSSAFWLDSSELAAAGFSLGIPHPPGREDEGFPGRTQLQRVPNCPAKRHLKQDR